jgi:hypothetical protein
MLILLSAALFAFCHGVGWMALISSCVGTGQKPCEME